MTKTPETFHKPEMPTIITNTGPEFPKTDKYMTYTKKKNIDEAIRQQLSKKLLYKTDMLKIYNLILDQTKEKLQ